METSLQGSFLGRVCVAFATGLRRFLGTDSS